MINLLIEEDRLEVLKGEPQAVELARDDGSTQVVFRCPECQIAVFSVYTRPDVRFVRAGTLDDPSWSRPQMNLWCDSAQPWVSIDDAIPAYAGNPPQGD